MTISLIYLLEAPIERGPRGPSSALASARYRALLPGQVLAGQGIAVHYADGRTNPAPIPAPPGGLAVTIIGKSFDPRTLETARLAKGAGHRVIVDFCDDHFAKPDIGAHFRALAALGDHLTAATEAMAAALLAATGRSASVIGDPVEGPAGQPVFKPAADRINLCWFGHPTNLDTLQPMFAALSERLSAMGPVLGGRAVRFEIVTTIDENVMAALRQVAQGLRGRVKIVASHWSLDATRIALGRADAVVIPSLDRGDKIVKSPNRLLEAINAGRVVAAHPLPSYGPFADCAYIGEDIWASLEQALADPEGARTRVGLGQKMIVADFTPEAIARQWLSVIEGRPIANGVALHPTPVAAAIRLNLGCGDKILPGYVNVDVAPSRRGQKPDVLCDIRELTAFDADYADEVLSVHVVEHLWRWEVVDILKEWRRVIKPGGRLILECPNLVSACEAVLKDPDGATRPDLAGQRSMWVLYGDPAWKDPLMCHRWAYTPKSLGAVMAEAGFVNIRQEPAQFKLREPRDMRVVGEKPN